MKTRDRAEKYKDWYKKNYALGSGNDSMGKGFAAKHGELSAHSQNTHKSWVWPCASANPGLVQGWGWEARQADSKVHAPVSVTEVSGFQLRQRHRSKT